MPIMLNILFIHNSWYFYIRHIIKASQHIDLRVKFSNV